MRKPAKPTTRSAVAERDTVASNETRPDTVLVLIDLQGGSLRRYVGSKLTEPQYAIGSAFIADLGLRSVRRDIEDFRRTGT